MKVQEYQEVDSEVQVGDDIYARLQDGPWLPMEVTKVKRTEEGPLVSGRIFLFDGRRTSAKYVEDIATPQWMKPVVPSVGVA